MILVAAEISIRTGETWASSVVVLSALSLAGLAGLLWRVRDRVPPALGGLTLLLAIFPAAVATFALRELAGLDDYPVRRVWALLILILLIPGLQLALQARRRAS